MRIKLVAIIVLMVVALVGCSNDSATELLRKVDKQKIDKEAVAFFDRFSLMNGTYLYTAGDDKQIFMIHYPVVMKGETAQYVESVTPEMIGKTLIIKAEILNTDQKDHEKLDQSMLFQINNKNKYDQIRLLINGEDTPIDVIGN